MRFHLLGVGSIGSLVGFHLKRSIRAQRAHLQPLSRAQARKNLLLSNLDPNGGDSDGNSAAANRALVSHIPPHVSPFLPNPTDTSVTLHVRQRLFAKQIDRRAHNSILVDRAGVRGVESGFVVERSSAASDVVSSLVRTDDRHRRPAQFQISRASGPSAASTTYDAPIPDGDGGVSLISSIEGRYHDPLHSPIDCLVITTKCDATLAALRPLLPRIHPWSTVVLIQNGMGVMDTLLDRCFPDPETRPNFVLATTTHGVWKKAPLNVVHAGIGELHFSVVPSPRGGAQGLEMELEAEMAQRSIAAAAAAATEGQDLPPLRKTAGTGWDKFAAAAEEEARSEQASSSAVASRGIPGQTAADTTTATATASTTDSTAAAPLQPLLDVGGIPDVASLRTLRHTVSSLLALPLNVQWIPVREYQLKALRKLAINACINPLTALADCKNGDLYANESAMDAMWSVCVEISAVLEAQVRDHLARHQRRRGSRGGKNRKRSGSSGSAATKAATSTTAVQGEERGQVAVKSRLPPASSLSTADLLMRIGEDGRPALDPSLTARSLYNDVQRAIRTTANNWSSMHADVKARRGSTEIDYINGYVSALGRGYGVETPANDLLTNLVKLKTVKLTGS
ncbi:uncharacterized protein PFL1_03429 [Pseudozyma flocculosa PF-1]|uniref:Related to 2-dehydropantoate 2-reductase n=2 Tax=Pseudozyma flocculosa TaxID=84751 RepID=A0A5C3FAX2_9BASI|nr:uncharacterized protein PFL1_03429 [Pseudozyma flocculosa PF-1]EPQ29142.1 hypothetical protein PFL1_03429 [Pseudozyma flocculosa PF-1]SPO41562.1 related to 2-dehydropantoate 2-reductase [Pseudozyma flocculosa]